MNIAVIARSVTEHTPVPAEDTAAVQQPAQITSASATPDVPTPSIPLATDLQTTDESSRIGQASVTAVITVPSNLRQGPGTEFELVGSIAVGEEVAIVGINPARDWYHIRFGDLGDAWIYSELLSPAGDIAQLPVESGPAQPTAVEEPVAAEQTSEINLVIDAIIMAPDPLVCNTSGTVSVDIRNIGAQSTAHGAEVAFKMIHVASGNTTAEFNTAVVFSAVPGRGNCQINRCRCGYQRLFRRRPSHHCHYPQ